MALISDKILFIIVLFIFTPSFVFSQKKITVSGYVTDKINGEIISNANISINDVHLPTNNYGYFSLSLNPGIQFIRVSHIGYQSYLEEVELSIDTAIFIRLYPGIELPEIVLTSDAEKNITSQGLGNFRINVGQLQTSPLFLGERDIVKIIQFLPGVSPGMEGSSQLNIRGGTNDQTLYLMDDVPIYNQNHTYGFFSVFHPDAIRSVDFYKGGIPAMYGDRLSGVASISLKDGNDKERKNSFTIGLLALSLSLEGPILKEKISYILTARKSTFDLLYMGYMALSSEGEGGGALFGFYDINGKLSWKINAKTKLSWQIYSGQDDIFLMNKEKSATFNENFQEKHSMGWKNIMSSLRLTTNLNPNIFSSTSLYYTQLNNFNYSKIEEKIEGRNTELYQNKYSLLQEIGIKSQLEHKTGNTNSLFYGLSLTGQTYFPNCLYRKINQVKTTYRASQLNLLTASIFGHNEFRQDNWLFNIGLRTSLYNNAQENKFAVDPRIKVNYFPGNKNKLMAAFDMAHQPVQSINEMNYNIHSDFWVPFKENNLPQSHQFSLGWKNYTTNDFNFSVEAYYKEMNNLLLVKNFENYLDFHSDYEIGKGYSKGVELMAEYNKDRFSSWLTYVLSDSKRKFEGETYPFKYDALHDISGYASYIIHNNKKNTNTISSNFQYKTGYPYYIPEISYPSAGLPTLPNGYSQIFENTSMVDFIPYYPNIRLNNYFRVDINFTMNQKLKHGSRTWQFSLLNITAHDNPYAVYKKGEGYKAFILIPFMPSFSFTRSF